MATALKSRVSIKVTECGFSKTKLIIKCVNILPSGSILVANLVLSDETRTMKAKMQSHNKHTIIVSYS